MKVVRDPSISLHSKVQFVGGIRGYLNTAAADEVAWDLIDDVVHWPGYLAASVVCGRVSNCLLAKVSRLSVPSPPLVMSRCLSVEVR